MNSIVQRLLTGRAPAPDAPAPGRGLALVDRAVDDRASPDGADAGTAAALLPGEPAPPPAWSDAFAGRGAPAASNPYVDPHLLGRAEFTGMFADLAKGKRNWQLAFFCALPILAVSVLGNVIQGTQSKIVTIPIAYDEFGRTQVLPPADQLREVPERIVVRDLTAFIRDLRTVTADPAVQQDMVTRAYAFVDATAAGFLNEYFADPENDPRLLSTDLTRLVTVTSVLPVPGAPAGRRTWKLTWTETAMPRTAAGGLSTSSAWEAYLQTRVVPPTTADERLAINPLGLFITSINWTRLAARTAALGTVTAYVPPPVSAPLPTPSPAAPMAPGVTP